MFRHGLKFGFIPRGSSGGIDEYNPMKLVSAPVKTDLEAVQLSGSEAVSVIRNISDPLVKVLVILIAVTGMRISEALALSWDSIDWVRGKIHIHRKWNSQAKVLWKAEVSDESQASRNDYKTCDSPTDLATREHVCEGRRLAFPFLPIRRQTTATRQHDRRRLRPACLCCRGSIGRTRRELLLRRRTRHPVRLP